MKQAHAYQHGEHRVHLIIYHLIWCARRRKPVVVGPVAARCREVIEAKGAEHHWVILALAIQPEHIHLVVRVTPSDSACEVIQDGKGVTSLYLRREFPQLMKLPSMWTRSALSSPAGNVSQATIRKYSAAQTGR